METTLAKGEKAPAKTTPVKAKNMAEEEDEDDDDEDDEGKEEETVKKVPGKQKEEMTKKQKMEGTEPTTAFNLFVRNLDSNKSPPTLKTGIREFLSEETTKEILKEFFDGSPGARTVTDWETRASKGFGFVDINSEEDAKASKEAMEDGEIDRNKVTSDWAKPKVKVASGAMVVAEAAKVDLKAEAGEALEGDGASEEAGEEEETTGKEDKA
ncbi:Nucleolin [Heterocephalus glaber]|uniref:Nucleolin n=1 Tax=Heterocephalus glaber TaxID=10181 RepID=G5BI93_HETGA|nr:Nucleolin [Heterocephalus glaber]